MVNPSRFNITVPNITIPNGVEVVWVILSPKIQDPKSKIKRICFASVYISPRSKFKSETIAHLVESIHIIRAQYNNEIQFCCGGDYNKTPIGDLLDCLGTLQGVQKEPTRKNEVLDLIITDLHTSYLPTATLDPLTVDTGMKGVDSDHRMIIFAPVQNKNTTVRRKAKVILTRPILNKNIQECGKIISTHKWSEVFDAKIVNEKVQNFHKIIQDNLNEFFPQKEIKISSFDKKWFSPELRLLHRKKQREFHKHRYSEKFKTLNKKFKYLKQQNIRNHYVNLTQN